MENSNQMTARISAFRLAAGFCNTQVVAALVKLNVIETIGNGSLSVDEIATVCKLDKNVLSRTLRYASFAGIVSKHDEKYALTEVGKCFLKDAPGSLYGSVTFISAAPWKESWNNFSYCLKTGKPAFDHTFGKRFFEFLNDNEEYGQFFNHYMTTMSTIAAPAIAEAYDFGKFDTICDVGGGQGILLKAILQKHSQCKGILFDSETVIRENVLGETLDRVKRVPGSFFEEIPPADCLVLKSVIHDWNDEDSVRILTNCQTALNKGGKLILVEQVVEEPYAFNALFYDLHMQVMLGGAERTEKEFASLLQAAGLRLNRIIPTKSPAKIIEAAR